VEFTNGVLVLLDGDEVTTYQLVSVEEEGERCWLRRAPKFRVAHAAFPVAASRIRRVDAY